MVIVALAIDGVMGDPHSVWTRLPHPVVLMGRLIDVLDSRLNDPIKLAVQRYAAGVLALMIVLAVAIGIGATLEALLRSIPFGSFLIPVLASVLLAQRSLYEHIAWVHYAFTEGGLDAARDAVARVVGRDPEVLDETGVCRAAIESCAENFSDGIVAPAFWFALFGLPGLIAYKFVNTADSMIGHRTLRHEAFGWASARFDDLLNFVPARLSGLFLALAAPLVGGSVQRALVVMWRDARQHRSPNAGWPESAAAGALDLALSGPRQYSGHITEDAFLNPEGRAARPDDIKRALRLLLGACGLEFLFYAALAVLV
jgi:adenosylcobinamide-phosphate synthase